jgi:S1-C subfamily serine protease
MSEHFETLSNMLADTVQATAEGIIQVQGRKRLGATGMAWRSNVIVTAHHVLRRDEGITVTLPDETSVPATLVGRDPSTDIAVLQVDADLQPLRLATADDTLRVGNLVLALGRPMTQVQATIGVVSAIGTRRMAGALTTDVVMYPGFSGGPLVSASGAVQGMNTSGFSRGASVAITTARINQVVDTLLAHGKVKQGFLGVGAQPVRLPEAIAQEIEQETGLILVSVEADSPAAAGGLMVGDILVSLDEMPTPHIDALMIALSGERVGQSTVVKLVRGGNLTEVNVTIGEKE